MTNKIRHISPGKNTKGSFNYLDDKIKSSLYRNGAVMTKRDVDGYDTDTIGMRLNAKELLVSNARLPQYGADKTCDSSGFELLDIPLDDTSIDFLNHAQVTKLYYGQCEELLAQKTGGRVYAFDHNIRSISGNHSKQRISKGQQVQKPIHVVHGDYTLTSAPGRLTDLSRPPSGNDTLLSILKPGESLIKPEEAKRALNGGRFTIVNVWRNITDTPVLIHPIAICDARSVDPKDLVVLQIHYSNRIGENYLAKYASDHCWFYYPAMTCDEVLLIKQWDSWGTLVQKNGTQPNASSINGQCSFSLHTAFKDIASPQDAPDRWSIEVRCLVIYD